MAFLSGPKSKRRKIDIPVTQLKEAAMILTFPADFLLWAVTSYF